MESNGAEFDAMIMKTVKMEIAKEEKQNCLKRVSLTGRTNTIGNKGRYIKINWGLTDDGSC